MSTSYRYVVHSHGRTRCNFNADGITPLSVVHISAGEVASDQGLEYFPPGWEHPQSYQKFAYNLGDADMSVTNISPHVGGVEFILHVDWREDLNAAVTITVEDAVPVDFKNPWG